MTRDENIFKRKQCCFFTKTTPAYNYLVISVYLSFYNFVCDSCRFSWHSDSLSFPCAQTIFFPQAPKIALEWGFLLIFLIKICFFMLHRSQCSHLCVQPICTQNKNMQGSLVREGEWLEMFN